MSEIRTHAKHCRTVFSRNDSLDEQKTCFHPLSSVRHDMEGYQELLERLLNGLPAEQRLAGLAPEQRLAGLAPEQRLAGLAPEQRLAGLDRDHQALALPVEVLHLLPESYFRSLSLEVVAEIRRRLRKNDR
jgi:hypothetical protein